MKLSKIIAGSRVAGRGSKLLRCSSIVLMLLKFVPRLYRCREERL